MFDEQQNEHIFNFLMQSSKKIQSGIPHLSDDDLQMGFDFLLKSKSVLHGKIYHAFLVELVKRPHIREQLEFQNLSHAFLNLLNQSNKLSEKTELEDVLLFLIEQAPDDILKKADSFEQYFTNKCASIHNERLFQYGLEQLPEDILSTQLSKGKTLGHWLLYIQWGQGITLLRNKYPEFTTWKDEQGVTVQEYIDKQDLSRWISNCIR